MTFDVQSGKELRKPVTHSVGIASLALEQSADGRTTYLALVDKNRCGGLLHASHFFAGQTGECQNLDV